ncbi:MAG: LCP family protein [Clostridia bacterium]|nr:LCP family protein [Clostridia bacterium]
MRKKTKGKKTNPVASFLWKDKSRRAKNFYFVLTVFVIFAAIAMAFINEKLDLLTERQDDNPQQVQSGETTQIIYPEDELELMDAIHDAGSINEYLYQWANNNGTLYSSKNVINILLVGLDSEDALENGGRSDTLILVSLNKATEKINMTSFFRDSWTYMNIGGEDRYNKINSSYYHGGPECLIDTIEKNFKIDIDYYVAVDFSSFVDIINALGGLTVEVQEYEANYINRTTVHTIESGPAVTLNGYEALVFARIRKSDSDSDVSRTRRQRMVIEALINSAKGATITQLNDALNTLFQHVKTDLTQMQILSYATQALTKGWINYEIVQHTLSDEDVFTTGYVGDSSVVFMDFPLAAQRVQNALYGDTNIDLDEDRVKLFSLITRFG